MLCYYYCLSLLLMSPAGSLSEEKQGLLDQLANEDNQ